MAPRMRDAHDAEFEPVANRARNGSRTTSETAAPEPFGYRPGMPTDARSLTMLQRSAGNGAVATLLRQRPPTRRPAAPLLPLQRFNPGQRANAPATPTTGTKNGATTDHAPADGAALGGPVDESIMIGTSGGGKAPAKGGGGGRRVAGPPASAVATAHRVAIVADAAMTNARLAAELASSQARVGAQVGAAKTMATAALTQATAMSQAFFASKHAEVVSAATAAEQMALQQATAMTVMAQGQAAATYAQLHATAASLSAGLQGRVSGFADQIVGAIGGLNLPDLPGVSQLKSAATGLVRRAASGVTAGIGFVHRLISGALRAGITAVSSMIGKAGQAVMTVVRKVGAAIRSAAAAVTRTLMAIAGRISQVLGQFLRGVVFPALERLRTAATSHLVKGFKKAKAAVKANTDYHLSMLDKVARLAPAGGSKVGGPAGAGAGDEATASLESIGKSARENNKLVVDLFGGRLRTVVASIADMAKRAVINVGQRLSGAVTQIVSTVAGKVQEALQPVRAVVAAISSFIGSIVSSIRGALTSAVEWVRGAAASPIDQLVAFGSSAVGKAKSFLGSLVRNVLSGNFTLPGLGLGEFRPNTNAAGPVPTEAVTNSLGSSSSGVLGVLGTVAAVAAAIVLLPALLIGGLGLLLVALAALVLFAPFLALAALLLYGLYRLGKWIFTPSKLAVEHETSLQAPGGAPKTRVEVGVGEKVKFEANKSGKWKATDGSPMSGPTGSAFRWTAPDRAGAATISIGVPGSGTEQVEFKVVEPSGITAKRESTMDFAKGHQGAGMILDFTYGPSSVSFGRVSAREVAGPASELDGYYAKDGERHFHQPASSEFFQLGEDNRPAGGIRDRARQSGSKPPWEQGRFVWVIPNKFQVAGEDGDGKFFANTEQEFLMADESGKTTINKAGATVTRTP